MPPHPPTPEQDRAIMWAVILVIGMLVAWATLASLVGGTAGFALAVVAGAVAASIGWRHRITFDLLCNLALVAMPAVVLGLSFS